MKELLKIATVRRRPTTGISHSMRAHRGVIYVDADLIGRKVCLIPKTDMAAIKRIIREIRVSNGRMLKTIRRSMGCIKLNGHQSGR